jgi:hypothetical protein
MEEKYQELKTLGRSENEAIGAVISEFGNVEELFAEMGMAQEVPAPAPAPAPAFAPAPATAHTHEQCDTWPHLQLSQIQEIKQAWWASSKGIGFGTLLVLLGVAVMVALNDIFARFTLFAPDTSVEAFEWAYLDSAPIDSALLSMIAFFIFLVPAVGLFVFYGIKISRYQFLEKGEFYLDKGLRPSLEAEFKQVQETSTIKIVAGTVLCVGSVLVMFIISTFMLYGVGVSIMLALIGIAVYLFITGGMQRDIYDRFLRKGEYEPKNMKLELIMNTIASVYWPLIVVVYLVWSFMWSAWGISWIIWPIAGLLFGALSAILRIVVKGHKENAA